MKSTTVSRARGVQYVVALALVVYSVATSPEVVEFARAHKGLTVGMWLTPSFLSIVVPVLLRVLSRFAKSEIQADVPESLVETQDGAPDPANDEPTDRIEVPRS